MPAFKPLDTDPTLCDFLDAMNTVARHEREAGDDAWWKVEPATVPGSGLPLRDASGARLYRVRLYRRRSD